MSRERDELLTQLDGLKEEADRLRGEAEDLRSKLNEAESDSQANNTGEVESLRKQLSEEKMKHKSAVEEMQDEISALQVYSLC